MSRSFKGKKPKEAEPSHTARDFLNAVQGYETTKGDSIRRDNRTQFSTVLNVAVKAGLVTPHTLRTEFGISKDQLESARLGKSADVPKETRVAIIDALKPKAEDLVSRMS